MEYYYLEQFRIYLKRISMNVYKRITYFWLRLEIDTIVYLDDAFSNISDRVAVCVYDILMKNNQF